MYTIGRCTMQGTVSVDNLYHTLEKTQHTALFSAIVDGTKEFSTTDS